MAESVEERAGDLGRRPRWAAAALATALSITLPWFVHPWFEAVNDAALYILTARSIVAGDGYSYQGVPFLIRPPGFGLLIAPLLYRANEYRANEFFLLNLLVSLFGVATLTGLFAFYRGRLGTWPCAAVCGAIWVSGAWQRLCNQVLSDVPGVALVFACLLLDRRAARSRTMAAHVALGLAIGVGMYVRTAVVLAIPAVLCARAAARVFGRSEEERRVDWKPVLAAVLIPILLQAPWTLRNARADVPVPPEHVYLHSYSAAMWHTEASDPDSPRVTPSEVLARLPENTPRMLATLGSRLRSTKPGLGPTMVGLLIALGWLVALVRRRGTAELLAGGFLLVLSIYFAFKTRLMLPAYLLMLPAAVDSALWLLRRGPARAAAPWVVSAALVVMGVLDFHRFGRWPALEAADAGYRRVATHCRKRFPDGAPLAAPVAWHYGVYLPERSVYSMHMISARADFDTAVARMRERGVAGALCPVLPGERDYLERFREAFGTEKVVRGHAVFDVRP